ncbi:centromere protein P isoform X2 [Macaca nemestrina]|uniref:centromere protein P isoform X2 n=1 Tax=Macaca nemestrina TaxID=9545 RepID=UPI0039B9B5AD
MDAELAEERVLQAEIAAVRRACENPPAPWEEKSRVQKSFQAIHQFTSEGWKSSKDLKNQLGHLESELSFLSTLTGINIRNYSRQTEDLTSTEMAEKSIRKVLQRHRLSGNCHMVTFQLEFQILEIQNKERLSSAVTDLNIIMEPTECSELSEFVSRAEDRKDLFMFFRSLHFFVEWFEYRKRTFKHFKYHYAVELPERIGKKTFSSCPHDNLLGLVRTLRISTSFHLATEGNIDWIMPRRQSAFTVSRPGSSEHIWFPDLCF